MSKKKSAPSYRSAIQFIIFMVIPSVASAAVYGISNYPQGDTVQFVLVILLFFVVISGIVLLIPTVQKFKGLIREVFIFGKPK